MSKLIMLEDIKEYARKFLRLKTSDEDMVDVLMAVYFSNKLDADPLWVFFNGPPSSAKTELLLASRGHPETFFLSSITQNTFLSGKLEKDAKTKKKKDCSLLPHMTGKLIIIKDFTTVLSMNENARQEIYSQLREIYDGVYSKAYGTGDVKSWDGKISIVAGVTPAIDKQVAANNLLGERFLHYRVGGGNRFSVAKMALRNSSGIGELRANLREMVVGFMEQLDRISRVKLPELHPEMEVKLAALAIFCASARTSVDRNRYNQTVEVYPEPEGPARVAKQFRVLAESLAVVRNQNDLDDDIYQIICKVARDSMPKMRWQILKAIWDLHERSNSWHTTLEISEEVNMPKRTVHLKLEDLMLLKLVNRRLRLEEGETLQDALDDQDKKRPYEWAPSADLAGLADHSRVFHDCANN